MVVQNRPHIRIVQAKKKGDDGVYVNLSSKKTGLNPGDPVQVEILGHGIMILKKLKAVDFKTSEKIEPVINNILESLGLKEHVQYKIKS